MHVIMIEIIIRKKIKDVQIVVLLKHLSTFWRTFDIPLINCESILVLKWSENCVLTDIISHAAFPAWEGNSARPAIRALRNATVKTTQNIMYQ